jgi:hypothetical protein
MAKKKKADFKDILRGQFPVNVGGLLGDSEQESRHEAVSPDDTVAHQDIVSSEDTIAPSDTVTSHDTVSLIDTVSSHDTVSPCDIVPDSSSFLMDAAVFDTLAKRQTPYETLVYLYLYRLSWGRGEQTCFVGLSAIMEWCRLSKNTVRKALSGLETKGHIAVVGRVNEASRKGTTYRVFVNSS